MLDIGQQATERAFADVQRRLKRNYRQAVHEMQDKLDAFNAHYRDADLKMRKKLKDGKITKTEYRQWQRGKVFQSDLWQKQINNLTETLYTSDVVSQRIVNGERINVFASNANAMAYSIEHGEGYDFGFGYYDSATVARILKEQPNLLPPRIVKRKEDVEWYHKLIDTSITQGIIQGEGIPEIARRIAETTGERALNAAVRNARTAMTSAQNAGRLEVMHEAQRMGIKVKKRWMATLDARTRDAHRDLDGQEREVDDPFESDLGDILFPGDPAAEPALVYNCRCTMTYVHPEYPSSLPRRDNINGEIVGDMTYREWESWKQGDTKKKATIVEKFSQYTADKFDEEYEAYAAEYESIEKRAERLYQEASTAYKNRRKDPEAYKPILEEYEKTRRELLAKQDSVGAKYGIEATAHKAQSQGIAYKPIAKRRGAFDENEIISRLGGGDMTQGSCASLGFCWAGQRAGYEVLDFRDGESRKLFSTDCKSILRTLADSGMPSIKGEAKSYITAGKKVLKAIKDGADGKEYYFECARHAAIVRKKDGALEYLELQSSVENGWQSFTKYFSDEGGTLNWRFGAPKSSEGRTVYSYAVDLDEMAGSDRFLKLLGYINTDANAQHKGASGHER